MALLLANNLEDTMSDSRRVLEVILHFSLLSQ